MYVMVVAQVLPLLLLKSILILDIVIRIRDDEDDGEDSGEDDDEDDGEDTARLISTLHATHTYLLQPILTVIQFYIIFIIILI